MKTGISKTAGHSEGHQCSYLPESPKKKSLNIFNQEILAYVTLFISNKGELKNA
jgi:hypothetical protein